MCPPQCWKSENGGTEGVLLASSNWIRIRFSRPHKMGPLGLIKIEFETDTRPNSYCLTKLMVPLGHKNWIRSKCKSTFSGTQWKCCTVFRNWKKPIGRSRGPLYWSPEENFRYRTEVRLITEEFLLFGASSSMQSEHSVKIARVVTGRILLRN